MLRSIGDNINAATLGRRARMAPSRSHESERAQAVVDRLRIKTPDHRNLVSTLSGGNQQRVVLGKWIETTPRVLVLDRPTVGVDVGSKAGIYDVVRELAADGVAILLVTDEIDELVDLCDHVLVMNAGRVVADGRPEEITEAELRRLVAGRETVPC